MHADMEKMPLELQFEFSYPPLKILHFKNFMCSILYFSPGLYSAMPNFMVQSYKMCLFSNITF